jgi:hypothetical protein
MWPSRVGSGTGAASFSLRRASRAVGRWPFPCPGCPGPAFDAETAPAVPHAPSSRCFPSEDTPARLPPPSARNRSHELPWAPLLEFFKDRPSTDIPVCVHARFPEVRVCHTRTCSTLVVLPDFGGLLRTRLAGLLHPATGHGVHLVSSRPPTAADARPSSEVFLPFEALRRDSGSPVARSPSSASLVRGDRSHRLPRPRGFVPSRSSTCSTSLWLRIAAGAGTSSHGFPSTQAFTGSLTVAGGSRWFPRCPVLSHRVFLPHSGRCAQRETPSRFLPRGGKPWRSRREPGFPRFRWTPLRGLTDSATEVSLASAFLLLRGGGHSSFLEPSPTGLLWSSLSPPEGGERTGRRAEALCPPGQVEGFGTSKTTRT